MNRQVVGFLSLFSLVLVLSIYYVATPSASIKTDKVGNNVNENVDVKTDNYYFSAYSLVRDENHKQEIEDQVAIISQSESTSEEVAIAKEKVEKVEKIIAIEHELQNVINEIPFNASYVEITNNEFIVMAYKKDGDAKEEKAFVLSIFDQIDTYLTSQNISFVNTDLATVEIVY